MRLEAFIRLLCLATFLAISGAVLVRASGESWGERPDPPARGPDGASIVGVIVAREPGSATDGHSDAELERELADFLRSATGPRLEVAIASAADPGAAARAARHLLRDRGAIAIVADGPPSIRRAIVEVAAESAVPVLATRPAPIGSGRDEIIDLAGSPEQRALPALAWGIGLFGPRVAIVVDDRAEAEETRALVRSRAGSDGGAIVADIVLSTDPSDHAAALAPLAAARPSFLILDLDGDALEESLGLIHRMASESAQAPCIHLSEDASRWIESDRARRLVGDYVTVLDWLDAAHLVRCAAEVDRAAIAPPHSGLACDVHRIEGALALIARGLARAGGDEPHRLAQAIRGEHVATPHGVLAIDQRAGDAWSTLRVLRVAAENRVDDVLTLPRLAPHAAPIVGNARASVERSNDD